MGYDDEQCPKRGAGLGHVIDDDLTCEECGKEKTAGFTLMDWMRAFRAGPMAPRVVKVSGEKENPADEATGVAPDSIDARGDFASLSEHEWHRLEVERWYREHHPDPDDAA